MAAGTSNAAPVAENVTNNEGMVKCVSVSLENDKTFLYIKCLKFTYIGGIFP